MPSNPDDRFAAIRCVCGHLPTIHDAAGCLLGRKGTQYENYPVCLCDEYQAAGQR